MNELQAFLAKLHHDPRGADSVGIEQEMFLRYRSDRNYAPSAAEFLARMREEHRPGVWKPELSACQVEYNTAPHAHTLDLQIDIRRGLEVGQRVAKLIGCDLVCEEAADETLPAIVYDDPRYARISKLLSPEALHAACRVAGIHVHIGVGSPGHALGVYGVLRNHLPKLIELSDGSNGLRRRLYERVAGTMWCPEVNSTDHLLNLAHEYGFAEDPRNCWWPIRFSVHGTIEVRVFGSTRDINKILSFVHAVREISSRA